MSSNKVKGIFKGFRYLSQIFENGKEEDIQIGYPTDVKHVAHIGWDGPSVNSPSWMNEFKSSPGFASTPLVELQNKGQENIKWASKDSKRRSRGEFGVLPKASKRQSTGGGVKGEKSNKPRQSRKSSKKPKDEFNPTLTPSSMDSFNPPLPKKSHGRRSKQSSNAPQSTSDSGSPTQSNSINKPMPFQHQDIFI